ncbi:MAG TPA: TraM recognition domain-containing protein [Candidatus Saccharibacteria bacterium]|nr:TraM recognition domain-containing protein [Candidatus Saccharibacteria bacterium]
MDAQSYYVDAAIRHWPTAVTIVASIVGIVVIVLIARAIVNRRFLLHRDMVWLEITPPASIAKTPEATEQLFSVIHGARAARQLKERLYNRSPVMSFEIVSTRKDGIRYLLQLEKSRSKNIQKAITSYIPDSKVKEVERATSDADKVIEFKETGHYVLPLTLTSVFEQHDPLGYVTGAMTKLGSDEEITLQIVAMPVRLREADILSHKILGNENILQQVSGKQLTLLGRFTNIFGKASSGLTDLAGEVYMGTTFGHKEYYNSKSRTVQQQARITTHDRPARTLSAFELELMETMHQKVTRPLFQVNLRILVKSPEAAAHISALKSALDGYSVPPYQSIKAKVSLPVVDKLRSRNASNRVPSLSRRSGLILASTELASLYHFPSSQVSKTDNLITSLSKTLPAPVSLKSGGKFDVIVGENIHHNSSTLIGLTEQERERHEYIIGGTGNGKTTLLQYQIVQDMQCDKGIAVVDPHGDMAETLLRHVPPERIKDVIYFNPDDLEYPIGLNLLELTPGLTGNELLREKDIITESVISVFRKIFSDEDTGGHRIEYVLRNTIQTALTVENPTLFTVFDLLNDPKYRKSIIKTLEDKNLINFWKNEIGKAGDMQKVKMAAGITAKIGRFLFSASARQILEQPKSTIDFDDIINNGKILICNFSKGLLGEDTSELFGITVLAKLQLASLRRARLEQSKRRPFYLYVDEFQNFATTSFVQMLSEARKYKLFLTMAEQSTSQQSDQQMVSIIMANVGTVISFRTGNPQDERVLLPLFSPYIEQGEISNLPAFNFYAKLSAVKAQEPLSGQTLLLANDGSSKVRTAIIEHSRSVFAKKQEVIEKEKEQPKPSNPSVEKNKKGGAKSKPQPTSEPMIDEL